VEAAGSLVAERPEPVVIRPPSRWAGFGLRELWRYRELLYFLAWRDLKVRYKQTFLGVTWAVLQPLMYMVVFTLFFGRLADLYSEGKPYALLALSGSVIWLFFANSVTLASNSLVGNAALITKVYFPRILVPIAPVIAAIVDFLLAFAVLLGVMAVYGFPPGFGLRVWFAIPFVLLAMGTAIGVGSLLAALNVKYRDVRYGVPFMIQLWLFASPVVYSSELLGEPWKTLYYLNPMAGVVEGFRWATLGGAAPSWQSIALSTASGAVMLVAGFLYFRRTERQFADIV
jgi:lipopolysaccharide transport system permease protein